MSDGSEWIINTVHRWGLTVLSSGALKKYLQTGGLKETTNRNTLVLPVSASHFTMHVFYFNRIFTVKFRGQGVAPPHLLAECSQLLWGTGLLLTLGHGSR